MTASKFWRFHALQFSCTITSAEHGCGTGLMASTEGVFFSRGTAGGVDVESDSLTTASQPSVGKVGESTGVDVLAAPVDTDPHVLVTSASSDTDPHILVTSTSSAPSDAAPADIRGEILTLSSLSWPIVISYLLSIGLGVISQLLVGRISAVALGSVALANMFVNATGNSIIMGTAGACDTLCSQAFGASNYARVGLVARRGVAIALCSSLFITTLWFFGAGPFFLALGIEREIAEDAQAYVRMMILALPAGTAFEVLKKPLISCGLSGVALGLSTLPVLPCALFGAIFVFGTPLGYLGGALGIVVAQWIGLITCLAFLRNHRAIAAMWDRCRGAVGVPVAAAVGAGEGSTMDWHDILDAVFPDLFSLEGVFDVAGWKEYLSIGAPSALMLLVEWGSYECLALLAGRLGAVPLAAHAVLGTTATLSFMPFLGFSVATCVRVGQCLGDLRPVAAQTAIRAALVITVALFCVNAVFIFSVRSFWGEVFTSDADVIAMVARILPILAVYTVFDGIQCILTGVMRGASLAMPAAAINLFSYVTGLFLAAGLGDPRGAAWGLAGIWAAFCVAVTLAATGMSGVLIRQSWEKLANKAHERSKIQGDGVAMAHGV